MWVVKIGGSLFGSPSLAAWLNVVANGGHPVILVPGGGPFADQVRAAQQRWHFGDTTAHSMALCAMDQYGLLMAGIQARLKTAAEPGQLKKMVASGHSAIWLPAAEDPDVDRSWGVTSDSLALWLAMGVRAEGVLLVKSASVTMPGPDLLDSAFEGYRRLWNGEVRLVHRDGYSDWPAPITA
ncbi:MAG: hypothetical protein OQL28_00770 [Sedimenticola sp.]|nr:hypothetical protein [Sedimenticola sp.]